MAEVKNKDTVVKYACENCDFTYENHTLIGRSAVTYEIFKRQWETSRQKKAAKTNHRAKLNDTLTLFHKTQNTKSTFFGWGSDWLSLCSIFSIIMEWDIRSTFFHSILRLFIAIFVVVIVFVACTTNEYQEMFLFSSLFVYHMYFDNSKISKVFTTYLRSTTSFTLPFFYVPL